MVKIDMEETRQLVVVVTGSHRTTITLPHAEGVEMLQGLTEYYGRLQYGAGDQQPDREGLITKLLKRFLPKGEQR